MKQVVVLVAQGRNCITAWLVAFLSLPVLAAPDASTKADCQKIMNDSLNPLNYNKSFMTEPKDVLQCIHRGWDPPKKWKPDEGKSKGVRVSGSGGFSYGSVQAPESPQSYMRRGVKASVKKEVMRSSCNFPPRIKFSFTDPPTIPKGSCWDFLNDLLKDKDGSTNSAAPDPGIINTEACAVESDPTGVYGTKVSISAGGSALRNCGGGVPVTTYDLVLNANPSNLVTAENESYYISAYRNGGAQYDALGVNIPLPTFLCRPVMSGDGVYWEKSVDLTPATAQMITYNPGMGAITIRLQSRAEMDANFIPPYNPDDPEHYLVIPLDGNGYPQVPPNCADESTYYLPTVAGREDIRVISATTSGCEGISANPTRVNEPTLNCPDGSTGVPMATGCIDPDTGLRVAGVIVDNWVNRCPSGDLAPPSNICPEGGGIGICPDASPPSGGLCSNGAPPYGGCGATSAASPDAGCDVVSIYPKGTFGGVVCDGKVQSLVLNRPNLYYPAGDTTVFHKIQGRTALMADTTANTQLYTQTQTTFYLQNTAPELTFNEGGFVKLKNGSIVIMNPPAKVNAGSLVITMPKGGQLVTAGGTQQTGFGDNSSYTIPAANVDMPLEVRVSRSVNMPAGFSIPTTPNLPHIRLPRDKPPEE